MARLSGRVVRSPSDADRYLFFPTLSLSLRIYLAGSAAAPITAALRAQWRLGFQPYRSAGAALPEVNGRGSPPGQRGGRERLPLPRLAKTRPLSANATALRYSSFKGR